MPDPVGLIGSINQDLPALTQKQPAEGPGFKNLLQDPRVSELANHLLVVGDGALPVQEEPWNLLLADRHGELAELRDVPWCSVEPSSAYNGIAGHHTG